MRLFAGANSVVTTVSPIFHVHPISHLPFRSPPLSLRVPNPVCLPPSHLTTGRSRMSSVSRQPLVYHLTGHGAAPSTCCLDINSPRVEYIHCPSQSKAMEEYIKEALHQGIFDHPAHQQPQTSSSWVRRTGACGRVSTIEL